MAFKGVNINKLNGGLGRKNPTNDDVCCLVIAADVSGIAATADTLYKLVDASGADALGFTAAYDAAGETLVRHHIEEFFRLAPDATLYVIPVATGAAQNAMLSTAVQNLIKANGTIKMIGIVNGTYTVGTTEAAVQTVVDAMATEHCRIDGVILEGTGDNFETGGADDAIASFTDLRALNAPNVSVCIAQQAATDALSGNPATNHTADVGAVLGMLAVRNVAENGGSVSVENPPTAKRGNESYPLSDAGLARWQTVRLSNNKLVSDLTQAELAELNTKGYIFAASYTGYAGVYLNGSPTCVAASSDYAYIENNRIWNKAARGIRNSLLPRVKSRITKDPVTGHMTDTQVGSLEATAGAALQTMLADGEISGYDVYIDKTQTVNDANPLQVKAQIVKDDIVFEFTVDLGFTTSL